MFGASITPVSRTVALAPDVEIPPPRILRPGAGHLRRHCAVVHEGLPAESKSIRLPRVDLTASSKTTVTVPPGGISTRTV